MYDRCVPFWVLTLTVRLQKYFIMRPPFPECLLGQVLFHTLFHFVLWSALHRAGTSTAAVRKLRLGGAKNRRSRSWLDSALLVCVTLSSAQPPHHVPYLLAHLTPYCSSVLVSLPVLHCCPWFCSTPEDKDRGESIMTGVRTESATENTAFDKCWKTNSVDASKISRKKRRYAI